MALRVVPLGAKTWYILLMTKRTPFVFGPFLLLTTVLVGCSVENLYPVGPLKNDTASTSTSTDRNTDSGTETGTETDTETGTASPRPWVGNVTQGGELPDDFVDLWDQVTPENEGKWENIESVQGVMEWDDYDALYDEAQTKNLIFKQDVFVWGKQVPSWMEDLSQTEQADEVDQWIRSFCERYPNIDLINVVSSPVSGHEKPPFIEALGGSGETGYDWVIWSFERAQQHCPGATLILNDHNVLTDATNEFIYIAKRLRERDLLGAVGCKANGLEMTSSNEIKTNLDALAELGVPIYISEYSINAVDDNVQRFIIETQFPIFYTHPAVAGITFWGYIENEIWSGVPYAYLIRADGTHRPALEWLTGYLGR